MKLAKVLNASVLQEILQPDRPVEEIVDDLFMKGVELSQEITPKSYSSWEEFVAKHSGGQSELVELEGVSDIGSDNVVILRGCPMAAEMKKLEVEGKSPAHFATISHAYKEQNPGSNAILHPGCIAHQVGRQLTIKEIAIAGKQSLNFYQLACRSLATGKIVYDENGLKACGMSHEKAQQLIEGFACLFALVSIDD